MALFNFDRGFWLLLRGGERIRFEAGVQSVPDEHADHWYLAENGTRLDTEAASVAGTGEGSAVGPDGSEQVPTPEETSEKAALQAKALALGIPIDGRWGVPRLKAEIESKA